MKKEAFQEIAKHFAESIKVHLRFEDGACPSTNGTEIILPTEMSEAYLDETLGALLHETNHIRYTDMTYFRSLDTLSREVGNVLEDIRVDNKALSIYPNSRCFYMALVEDVLKRCKDALAKEALPMKILKGLILNSVGVNIKDVYGTDENWDTIEEKTNKLQGTINKVICCNATTDLAEHIVTVIKEVFGDLPEKPKQTGKGNPDTECNGGQGGEGTASAGDGGDSGNQEPGIEDSAEVFEDYTDLLDKDQKIQQKQRESTEKMKDANDEYVSKKRSAKTYDTKARKLQHKENYGNTLTKEEQEKKEMYEEKAKSRWQEVKKASDAYSKESDIRRKLNGEQYKYKTTLDNIKRTIDKIVTNEFARTGNCNLLGFNALDNDKLKDKNYVDIPYSQSLDELIKETLILKQEEYIAEETGKINTRFLHEIYTDVENLFQEKEEKKIKTMVSLVFDVSGSMRGEREDLCLNAVNTLAGSFSKAVKEGAPGDMRLWAFGTNVLEVAKTVENFKPFTKAHWNDWENKGGGGTNLSLAVNAVVNEVSNDPEYRNVIIIMTDAEVDGRELDAMTNLISTGDVRVMYIAIASSLYYKEAQELFGSNNITSMENSIEILQNVMFQGLHQVS